MVHSFHLDVHIEGTQEDDSEFILSFEKKNSGLCQKNWPGCGLGNGVETEDCICRISDPTHAHTQTEHAPESLLMADSSGWAAAYGSKLN